MYNMSRLIEYRAVRVRSKGFRSADIGLIASGT